MVEIPEIHWNALVPQLILVGAILLVLAVELVGADPRGQVSRILAAGAGLVALGAALLVPFEAEAVQGVFGGMLVDDGLLRVFAAVILLAAVLVSVASGEYLAARGARHRAEFQVLLLSSALGMILVAGAADLVMLFLGLELFSLALYLLCLHLPERPACQEAAVKYFFLSSLASAVLLFGAALVYGASGTTRLAGIASAPDSTRPLLVVGSALMAVGLAFKLAAVPFHLWAPDVYQGAPTPVTAFLSVATKTAALAALVRLFPTALMPAAGEWKGLLWILAVLTMLGGNLLALAQRDLKRLLACSSVAHGGYLLIAPISLTGGGAQGMAALLYYLLVYAFMNVGAFAVVMALEAPEDRPVDFRALSALAARRPGLAAALAVFMLGLAGLPPTGGFFAKFYLFGAAVASGHPFLAGAGILGSLLGIAYYLRVVVAMYMDRDMGEEPPVPPPVPSASLVIGACVLGTLLLGFAAQPSLHWAGEMAAAWFAGLR